MCTYQNDQVIFRVISQEGVVLRARGKRKWDGTARLSVSQRGSIGKILAIKERHAVVLSSASNVWGGDLAAA